MPYLRQLHHKEELDEDLVRELAASPFGRSPAELVRSLGWSKKTVWDHLKNLEESGRVRRSGTGKSGRGVRLVAVEDGISTEDGYRSTLRHDADGIFETALREGRVSSSQLMEGFAKLVTLERTHCPLPRARRGRPHRCKVLEGADAWEDVSLFDRRPRRPDRRRARETPPVF